MFAASVDFDVELQTVAFVQIDHAGAFDRADMDKGVGLAVIALDEAEAFHRVEEFDRAGCRFACQLALRTPAATKTATFTRFARFAGCRFGNRKRFAVDFKVGRRHFAAAIHQRECKLLPFGKTGEARLFDRADVNKHIFAAFIALDEAKAFLAVEKFDDAIAFADDLGGHIAARTAATAASEAAATTATEAAAITATAAAKTATVAAAESATATAAASEAAAITAAVTAFLVEWVETIFAETIALVAPTSTAPTTAAVISVETHALNVTFASSLKL